MTGFDPSEPRRTNGQHHDEKAKDPPPNEVPEDEENGDSGYTGPKPEKT